MSSLPVTLFPPAKHIANNDASILPADTTQLQVPEALRNKDNATDACTAAGATVSSAISAGEKERDNEREEEVEVSEDSEDEESVCPVSDFLWFNTLQELPKENSKYNTVAKHYPKLWNMVKILFKHWKDKLKWHKPANTTNVTGFKNLVAEHVLQSRTLSKRSEIPAKYLNTLRPEKDDCNNAHYYFYPKEVFLSRCSADYKEDKIDSIQKEKAMPNDIIRLFSIATSQLNRDDLQKLSQGKAFFRSDMDGPLSMYDTVMQSWVIQFNDPCKWFALPPRATHLPSIRELDPNDKLRINIERNHIWLGRLYKKVMPQYNHAWQKWTKGTGGGSGMPENYTNWEKRECLEKFADYAEHGSIDYLAYMIMLDKQVGYCINTINDPAPDDTVTEDETDKTNGRKAKKRKTAAERIADSAMTMSDNMNDMVKDALATLKESFGRNNKKEGSGEMENKEKEAAEQALRSMEGMDRTMVTIERFDAQIESLEGKMAMTESSEEEEKLRSRVVMIEAARDAAFEKRQKFK